MQLIHTQSAQTPSSELHVMLGQLVGQGKIRAVDMAFAEFIFQQESQLPAQDKQLATDAQVCLAMLAAYVSAQTGEQHSCLELNYIGQPFAGVYTFVSQSKLQEWLSLARSVSCLKAEINYPEHAPVRPLVVQNNRVYLQRYWRYECELAVKIREKAKQTKQLEPSVTSAMLAELFPNSTNDPLDWQKVAVCVAACQSLSFITGGPGTGKTTTVAKLLALLQGLAKQQEQMLTIQLVAPTGKAAARLTESIIKAKKQLPSAFQNNLPEQCQTIHRLLGAKPLSPYFKANASHPLYLDVLVLDEASMVDLPLMTKLFAALPAHAQVILLGDQDQLASVETGCVLSDICQASFSHLAEQHGLAIYTDTMQQQLQQMLALPTVQQSNNAKQSAIQDNVVRLLKSHRFGQDSGIGQLAKAINQGQSKEVRQLLNSASFSDIHWYQPKQSHGQHLLTEIRQQLLVKLLPSYKAYIQAVKQGQIQQAFALLNQQQVLCAQKSGAWGVNQLNSLIESELHQQGLINQSQDFYVGRPVMLAKNDHQLKLFNGDIGIVMPDPDNANLNKVWFANAEGAFRGLLPSRLPSLDTLYAMTIHKSQGSEFDAVYLCLPPVTAANQGRGLNRELLYTGLTRAKKQCMLIAQEKALSMSLAQQCRRGSGLAERLIK